MPFEKGNKEATKKGKHEKTKQWEKFADYCINGGLEKFEEELKTLKGKAYVDSFTNLLEFYKPRLSRTTIVGDPTEPINVNYAPVGRKDK